MLRGTDPGSPCVIIRKGPRSRFVGAAFRAADARDVLRLADGHRPHGRASCRRAWAGSRST